MPPSSPTSRPSGPATRIGRAEASASSSTSPSARPARVPPALLGVRSWCASNSARAAGAHCHRSAWACRIGRTRPGGSVLERLAALRPDHLRVSLWTDRAEAASMVDAATAQALAVGCPMEAALFVDADDPVALRELVARMAAGPVPVVRWLAYDISDTYQRSTSEAVVRLVRAVLEEIVPGAALGAGTASDFVRLNRGRTLYDGVDGLAWAISPSFHAADDRSVMENARPRASPSRPRAPSPRAEGCGSGRSSCHAATCRPTRGSRPPSRPPGPWPAWATSVSRARTRSPTSRRSGPGA